MVSEEKKMRTIKGKACEIKVYQDKLDEMTLNQLSLLADQAFAEDLRIMIMPDCHAGKGCVIGTTMTIKDKIVPNLVGVDIGCGMLLTSLGKGPIDYASLDKFIHEEIPSGVNIYTEKQECPIDLTSLDSYKELKNKSRFEQSLGTLGGGNHFIEIDKDDNGEFYLVIHSGSRNLGSQVATYYQDLAIKEMKDKIYSKEKLINETIESFKKEGRSKDIQKTINMIKERVVEIPCPDELAFLEGPSFSSYLHDMGIVQRFAVLNREKMARKICSFLGMDFDEREHYSCIHNYIDLENMILRKGAISAQKGEKVIIPINMRDGTILGVGKGNPDYNYSAPHGAGRLYSRKEAKERFTVSEFKDTMKGVYSTSVEEGTLDESPFAYKSIDMILPYLKDTVDVTSIIKPVYNFKASEEDSPRYARKKEASGSDWTIL